MKIDGKQIAAEILEKLKEKVLELKKKRTQPHLVVILLGDNPASKSYVSQKKIKGEEIGIRVSIEHIPTETSQEELLNLIDGLNKNKTVHGVIVQRPLPEQINEQKITEAINPKKDVDGLHPQSKFSVPLGVAVLKILNEVYISTPRVEPQNSKFIQWLRSQNIVVIGKGPTGGGPVIKMFNRLEVKPVIIDSKTQNSSLITQNADILISAVGKQGMINSKNIKKGVILVSVGLHKANDSKLHGDYEENDVKDVASFYTPTPGGVGPVNVAMLLKNLVIAAQM